MVNPIKCLKIVIIDNEYVILYDNCLYNVYTICESFDDIQCLIKLRFYLI